MLPNTIDDPIRLGVIGLGAAGSAMVAAIKAHAGVTLAGGADLSSQLRQRFAQDNACSAHDSAIEMLDRADLDAVYIATPHQFHREHAMLAAGRGKHVIVEKPMALSLNDADEMIAASASADRVLIVGHTHGFDPTVRLMGEIIASGQFGRLSMIAMMNYTDFLYRPRRPEELDTALGGGIVYNQLPHQVDTIRQLAHSPVRSVRATADILDSERPTEGCCTAFISFENRIAASIVYSGYDKFDSDELCSWVGEGGHAKTPQYGKSRRALQDLGAFKDETATRSDQYGYGGELSLGRSTAIRKHQPHFGLLMATCELADLRQSPDGVLIYSGQGVEDVPVVSNSAHPGWSDVLDELYLAVRRGRPPIHDGQFGKETLRTCLALLRSSQQDREVFLSEID